MHFLDSSGTRKRINLLLVRGYGKTIGLFTGVGSITCIFFFSLVISRSHSIPANIDMPKFCSGQKEIFLWLIS